MRGLATASPMLTDTYRAAYAHGKGADSLTEAAAFSTNAANRLVGGAITLLVVIMLVGLAALLGGEFVGAIPSDSVYSNVTDDLSDHGETAFTIFAVLTLAIPVVAALGYIIVQLGPFFGGGGGLGGIGR